VARLVLVEDDASIAEPLVAALGREGHDVSWCPTGEGALASVGPDTDLVLLDLGLPISTASRSAAGSAAGCRICPS